MATTLFDLLERGQYLVLLIGVLAILLAVLGELKLKWFTIDKMKFGKRIVIGILGFLCAVSPIIFVNLNQQGSVQTKSEIQQGSVSSTSGVDSTITNPVLAFYPGYQYPTGGDNLIKVKIDTYEDLLRTVKFCYRRVDILQLTTGVYGLLRKTSDALSHFRAYNNKIILEPSGTERAEQFQNFSYHSILVMSRYCRSDNDLQDIYQKLLATSDDDRFQVLHLWVRKQLDNEERVMSFLKHMYFVDPFSSSGFLVPMKALDLYVHLSGENDIKVNWTGTHDNSFRLLDSTQRSIIIALSMIGLKKSQFEGLKKRKDVIIRIPDNIPQGPVCVRSDIMENHVMLVKKYLPYGDVVPVDENQNNLYDKFFIDYVRPALDNNYKHRFH